MGLQAMTFRDWLFGEAGGAALAGALGGVVRWLSLRESWKDGVISITVGAICAVYVSPLVIQWLGIADNPRTPQLAAFIVGIGGIGVVGLIIDMWRGWRNRGVKP